MRHSQRQGLTIVRGQKQKTIRVLSAGDQQFRAVIHQAIRHHANIVLSGEVTYGADAIVAAARAHPDLVVLGPCFPDVDGLVVTKQLVKLSPTINVLMVADDHGVDRVVAAIEAGVAGYLASSIKPEALTRAMLGVADGEVAMSRRTFACVLDHFCQTPELADKTKLTDREMQILRLVAAGATDKQISRHLMIAESTAKKHIQRIFYTLRAHNRTEAVAKFQELHGQQARI